MTLKELIDSFKEKNKDVLIDIQEIQGIPQPRISNFVKRGYAIIYKTPSGGITVRNAFVFVKNLNTTNEEAYWENNEPIISYKSSESIETFRNKVEKFIKSAIEKEMIYTAIIEDLDENLKSAIVKAIKKDNTGNYIEKRLAIRYNPKIEKVEYVEIS